MLSKKKLEGAAKCTSVDTCDECAMAANPHDCLEILAQTALTYRAMLEQLEWSRRSMFLTNGEYENHCPMCGCHKQEGHSSDCELFVLLKEV